MNLGVAARTEGEGESSQRLTKIILYVVSAMQGHAQSLFRDPPPPRAYSPTSFCYAIDIRQEAFRIEHFLLFPVNSE